MSNFAYIQPIFYPNEEMYEKNCKSVESFYDYYNKLNYTFECIFGGYCSSDRLWNDISKLISERSNNKAKVVRFDRNYGKAYVVNKLTALMGDVDYFLTADSDIMFNIDQPDIVGRLIEAFNHAKYTNLNPSLIALSQDEQNCHILELCYQSKYYYQGKYGSEMICKPFGSGGVAGGCICIHKKFWDLIGGYKVLGVYAADDANLMKDSFDRGYHFMLSDSIRCIHPFENNVEYCRWKGSVCSNSRELELSIQNADSFWKNNIDRFSYIIPHRTSTQDRKRNLDYLISYLNNNFKNIEIVVVEQDSEERYFNNNCVKVLYKNSGPFNRSKCLNIGYDNAKNNKMIFADNDLLIPHEQIREAIAKLDNYDSINPYKTVRDLNEDITNKLIKFDNFSVLTSYSERSSIVFSGGACCFTREGYAKIGGYDEEFIGWGGEDNACTHKIANILKYYELDGHCWHMNHSRTNELHSNYSNNLKILSEIESRVGNELITYCNIKRNEHGW